MALSVALTLLPIVLIVFLMVNRRFAADTSGVIGWLATLLIAITYFNTPLEMGLRSSLAGVIGILIGIAFTTTSGWAVMLGLVGILAVLMTWMPNPLLLLVRLQWTGLLLPELRRPLCANRRA